MSLLDLIISPAAAQAAPAQQGSPMVLIMMVLFFAVFYFMAIRPQMKRAKEHKAMIDALQKGDEIVAAGGVVGSVTKISDNYVTMRIAENVEIRIQRPAVQVVLPKGTLKTIE